MPMTSWTCRLNSSRTLATTCASVSVSVLPSGYVAFDVENAIIVDVEPTAAIRQAEVLAAKRMMERTAKNFALHPSGLLGDSAYGSAEMLGWLVDEQGSSRM
jgi:hypothetical protein